MVVEGLDVPTPVKFEDELMGPLSVQAQAQADTLDVYHSQYVTLQHNLAKAHESEQKLFSKCKMIGKSIRADHQKLTSLLLQHDADKKKRATLKQEIQSARLKKEELAKELHIIRGKMKKVQEKTDQVSRSMTTTNKSAELSKESAELDRQELILKSRQELLSKLKVEVKTGREDLAALARQQEETEIVVKRSQDDIDNLMREIKQSQDQRAYEQLRKTNFDRKVEEESIRAVRAGELVKSLSAEIEQNTQELNEQIKMIQEIQKAIADAERRVQEEQLGLANAERELRIMQESVEQVAVRKNEAAHLLVAARAEKEIAEKKASAQHVAMVEVLGLLATYTDQAEQADADKRRLDAELGLMKEQIEGKEGKRAALKAVEREKDSYVRAREVMSQSHSANVDRIRMNESALKVGQAALSYAQNELQGYLVSVRTLTKVIESLRRDKAAHEEDLMKKRLQRARTGEEVADRELKIAQLQQQITENEAKLHKQQSMIEKGITERNYFQKCVTEKRVEVRLARSKVAQLNAMIKRLRQELREKQKRLQQQHTSSKTVRKEIVELEDRNIKADDQVTAKKAVTHELEEQVKRLTAIIADADEELRSQLKQYNAIVNEHTVLSQYLVKRNDEVAHLYEHLKLQSSILDKSRQFYRTRAETMAAMQQTKEDLEAALDDVLGDNEKYDELMKEVAVMQKALVEERLKVRALTDELRNPINVHRWRRLKDTSAETYNMLKQLRTLQRAIIEKGAQVEAKDKQIQEKEKLYVALRRTLARQPGSEVVEQLRLYAATLREKREKHLAMKKDLKECQAKVFECKADLQRLQQDLQQVKEEYFLRRRREQTALAAQQMQMAATMQSGAGGAEVFGSGPGAGVGAGFHHQHDDYNAGNGA